MNKQRRKRLGEAYDLIQKAEEIIEAVIDEEKDALENLPDNFRDGERGEEMENYIEMMDETIGLLQDAESVVEQI